MFYALGMHCLAALFWKIRLPPARRMFCMMIAIHENTTFNTGKFPNPYLESLCTWLMLVRQVEMDGVGPMCEDDGKRVESGTGMRESAGVGISNAQARGAALHNQKGRRCTGYVISTKQRFLLRLGVARATACGAMEKRPWFLHGHCHAMRALKTFKHCNVRHW